MARPSPFAQRCYDLLKRIPEGKVTTYGVLAKKLGCKGARAVGQCVGANPFAPEVPCHRVVCSDGSLGGYSGGLRKKVSLLAKEGVPVKNGKVSNFTDRFYSF